MTSYRGAARVMVAAVLAAAAVGVAWQLPAAAVAPSNDAFASATTLSGNTGSLTATTVEATAQGGEPDHGGLPARHSVWFRWTPNADGDALFETCSGGSDTVIAAYEGSTLLSLTPVASNDNLCGSQSRVVFAASGGTPYRIAIDVATGTGAPFTLTWAHFVTGSPTPLAGEPALGTPGHRVEVRESASITNLGTARDVFALPADDVSITAVATDHGISVVNYMDTSDEAEFPASRQVATPPMTAQRGSYSVEAADGPYSGLASGVLHLPEAGTWRFHVGSDDGELLMIGTNDVVVTRCDCNRSMSSDTGDVYVAAPGYYPYTLTWYNTAGQSAVELYARSPSQLAANDPAVLVGDTANGGIAVYQSGIASLSPMPVPALGPAGHVVEVRKSDAPVDSLLSARALFNLPVAAAGLTALGRDDGVATINYLDSGADGDFTAGNRAVDGPPFVMRKGALSGDDDAFALRSRGVLYIDEPGLWEFAVSSSDGFRLAIGSPLVRVDECDCERDPATDTATVSVPQAGYYPYHLTWFHNTGGAEIELSAKGPSDAGFVLVGDVGAGGLAVSQLGADTLKVGRVDTTPGTAASVTITALDVTGYIVPSYRGTVRLTTNAAGATVPGDYTFAAEDDGSHTFTGLTIPAPGVYTVTAVDTSDATLDGSSPRVLVRPSVPTNLTAVARHARIVDLAWSAVAGADQYFVYRATSSSGPFDLIASTTATSLAATALSPGTDYWFRVRAVDNAARSNFSPSAFAATPPLPPAPTGVVATAPSSTKVTVSWDAVSGATGYGVYRASSVGGPYVGVATTPAGTTQVTFTRLTPATTYYFVVRAVNANGRSLASAPASVTTPPA